MRNKYLCLILVISVYTFLSGSPVLADDINYPQVASLSPATAKPGDIVTLNGKNFGSEGQTYCYGTYNKATKSYPDKKRITYKTVLGAYRESNSPTNGVPNYRLIIQSVSSGTITAQIPQDMANGKYVVGYNAEFARGICEGYGTQLVGFARYDPLTIVGGKDFVPAQKPTLVPSATPMPTLQPTVLPTPTSTPKIQFTVTLESLLNKLARILGLKR